MSVRPQVSIFALLAAILTISVSNGLAAQTADLDKQISQLLDLGQKYSPHALAEARALHKRMEVAPGYDYRARYAFVLVLARQRCLPEALHQIEKIHHAAPAWLPAWRMRVWLEMTAHKYPAAVADMRAAAKAAAGQFSPSAGEGDKDAPAQSLADELAETACFFGRTFTFLESQQPRVVTEGELRSAKQAVLSRLGEYRQQFSEGEETATRFFAEGREELAKARAEASAASSEQTKPLKDQAMSVDKEEVKVDFETEKLKTNVKKTLEDVDIQSQQLRKELLKVKFAADRNDDVINVQQTLLAIQIGNANNGRLNAAVRLQAQEMAIVIQARLVGLANRRMDLLTQANTLGQQLSELTARGAQTMAEGAATESGLQMREEQLKNHERRVKYALRAHEKDQWGSGARGRAIKAKQQTYTSFEPLAFDEEKERLIGKDED